jgi:hypothetical protein
MACSSCGAHGRMMADKNLLSSFTRGSVCDLPLAGRANARSYDRRQATIDFKPIPSPLSTLKGLSPPPSPPRFLAGGGAAASVTSGNPAPVWPPPIDRRADGPSAHRRQMYLTIFDSVCQRLFCWFLATRGNRGGRGKRPVKAAPSPPQADGHGRDREREESPAGGGRVGEGAPAPDLGQGRRCSGAQPLTISARTSPVLFSSTFFGSAGSLALKVKSGRSTQSFCSLNFSRPKS